MEEYFGIIYFSKILDDFFNKIIKSKNKLIKYIKIIISVSTSVQIVIAPIIILNYKTISATFFIANILTSFIITLIISLGFFLIIISFLSLGFAKFLGKIYQILLYLLLQLVEITAGIPLAKIYVKTPDIYQIIIYYFFSFLIRIFNKKRKT
ncbi:MAG: hypothetical protein HFJ50_01835 [Clostridia bacterium]|jgi:hypothetical protein|nr:hypothetical protein [Clostridia bacterium]